MDDARTTEDSTASNAKGYVSSSDMKMERRLQEDRLGADIIDECRTQLMLKFRFLDLALWRMSLEPVRVGSHYPLATDGKLAMYDPPRVVARFQESFDESVRDYLHMIMHCIFRHPFEKNKKDKDAWNLACDIIAESTAMDLCGDRFKSEGDLERRMAISKIKMTAGSLTPGKIYSLVENLARTAEGQHFRGIGTSALADWRALFERDDHGAWPIHAKPEQSDEASSDSPDEEFSENDEDPDMQSDGLRSDSPEGQSAETDKAQRDLTPEDNDSGDDPRSPNAQGGGTDDQDENALSEPNSDEQDEQDNREEDSDDTDPSAGTFAPSDPADGDESHSGRNDRQDRGRDDEDDQADRSERDWEEISKQIEMNLTTFSKEWGEEAASLMANLQLANRRRYDYTDFLRKFMIVNEEMQLNMDEFDTIFYTFGMDMYGNMPFIEPLEYKETQRIRDFAIIIDTSESVRGDLVRKFIEHTFDILKSSEDYSSEVNVHLIQADSKVQSDVRISNMRDVDKVMNSFVIRGMGGTDFRPAIDYVEMLRGRGELENLQGVLYFTDGFGQFPEKAPEFDVAFVFIEDEEKETPPVPPWAIKVTVDEESLDE